MKLAAVFLPFVFAIAINAGWIIDEVARYEGGEQFESRITIDAGRYTSKSEDEKLIIDLNNDTVYFVYDNIRQYFGGRLSDVVEEMRGTLMTEMSENDEMSDPHFADQGSAIAVEVKRLGDKYSAESFTGEKYQIIVDGELKKEVYIAPALTANREIDPKKLSRTMLMLAGAGNPTAARYVEMSDEYIKLMSKGYPIRTIEYDPGGGMVLTTIVKVEKKAITDSEFAPPKGYAKVKSSDIYKRSQ
ncbi:hypothetical protein FACS189487_05880 [Campylobacterota bacterium]|nr:hypothetical protein FACS189487_05880 [Campylobacterota bacterium]